MTEVMAYPFVSADELAMLGEPAQALSQSNPLDAAAGFLRTSLLPGLIGVARRNTSPGLVDLALFEFGAVFLADADENTAIALPPGNARPSADVLDALNSLIPAQPLYAAGLVLGRVVHKQPDQPTISAGLSDALSAVQQLALAVGAAVEVRSAARPGFHPGRTAELVVGSTVVGHAGELLPALCSELDLPRRVAAFELDLGALIEHAPTEAVAGPISSYPAATQDLSLVVAADVPAAEVRAAVSRGAGELLEHVELVDDYRGDGVDSGSKSLTFALRFRAPDRTLTAAEASEAKLAGVAVAAAQFGAVLRE